MQLEVLAEKGRHGEQRAMAGPLAQTLSNTAQGFESVCYAAGDTQPSLPAATATTMNA